MMCHSALAIPKTQNMKRSILILLTIQLFGLASTVKPQSKYFIGFTDKANSPYSIANPEQFLSQRSIARRAKQNLPFTDSDLPVNPNYIDTLENMGVIVHFPLRWMNGVVATASTLDQLAQIQNLSFVTEVKEIYTPTKELKGSKFNHEEPQPLPFAAPAGATTGYGPSATQVNMLNGQVLHSNGYLGDGVVVAVLDAGFYNVNIYPIFDSLRAHNRILGTKDFVNPSSDIFAEHHHGMMVLSIMGGYADGQLIGTAPHASYWLIRTEDASSEQLIEEYNWAAGAEFADSAGADIINTSLGYTTFDVSSQNHTYSDLDGQTTVITRASNMAASKGMLVVVSAGNDGTSPWHYISAPADSPNVLTIGAVDSNEYKAGFSSFGPTADGRVKPDLCAMGVGTIIATTDGGIGSGNGTSFSAPLISGMLACLWQAKPNLTVSELMESVVSSSNSFISPNNEIGYGIPDFALALPVRASGYKSNVRIIPNPFNSHVLIYLPLEIDEAVSCQLLTPNGSTILSCRQITENGVLRINVPQRLPNGHYIFHITTNSQAFNLKAIKN